MLSNNLLLLLAVTVVEFGWFYIQIKFKQDLIPAKLIH